jgi:hypothetical protein
MSDETALPDWMAAVDAKAHHDLIAKAKALVEAVGQDDNGRLVAGQWVAGNGGLLSRETIKAADALRMEIDKWK